MKQTHHYPLFLYLAIMVMALCSCSNQEKSSAKATQLMGDAHQAKDYERLMLLADSLEKTGELLPASADYWRGYACDRMKRKQEAVDYWRNSIAAAEKSTSDENLNVYVKSATRLANLLCIDGDYEGTLKMAMPVVAKLEELKCDTTSDFVNLLIFIGLSQVSTGQSPEDSHAGFLRACRKHRETIERYHSDEAYKDAIAGLVNIAYYCVKSQRYEPALYYTSNFGDLLIEYEQHTGVDAGYVDRQVGRYTIFKALALDRTGRKEEAAKTYEAFLATKFSQSAEGKALADDYQKGFENSEQAEEEI